MSACVDAVRLRLSDAQSAAAVQAVLVAGNHLQPQHVPALAEQLCKFPALKQLDVSSNLCLDTAFLALIGKALSSKAVLLPSHCVIRIFLVCSLTYRSFTFC